MHLIVVDVQRFIKMALSSLAGIFVVVVVVVLYFFIIFHCYCFLFFFFFSSRLVSI